MTISTELRKAGPFAGNGVTTAFPFSFKVFAATDVAVTRADALGAETALVLNSDFTVALNADQDAAPGGTATLAAPLAAGSRLTVTSAVPNLQPTDITNNGGFYPRVIEDALDRQVAQIQQIDEKVARALKIGITSALEDQTLPAPVGNTLLGWNQAGSRIENVERTEAALIGFQQAGTGASPRTVQDKLREWVSVKDFGALGNNTGDDAPLILASYAPYRMPRGTYRLQSSLKYRKDSRWVGDGKSFGGTILLPTGNFPALEPDASVAVDYTKNDFSDFQIDATNISSDYALKIDGAYLTSYSNIWIRNSYKGISITSSDAIRFYNVMIMENSNSDAVFLGDNARSIKFDGCNFEKSPGNTNPGGIVRLNGAGAYVTSADFYGCQMERGGLLVEHGSAKWYGGKATDSSVVFYSHARDCVFNDVACFTSTTIHDFGMCSRVENARAVNMDTPLHAYPDMVPAATGAPTFGAAGEEFLYVVSAVRIDNAGTAAGLIEIKEGGAVLSASPTFTLVASGATIGKPVRDSYTYITCVRNSAAASGPVLTNCSYGALRGGKSLLTNGTFNGGASTGWDITNASGSASGEDFLITPSSTSWKIEQSISGVCVYGKRYIAIAKYSGAAALTLGDAAGGTVGRRPVYSGGVDNVYGDGDRVAMISFQFLGQWGGLSLGNLGSNSAVTVKWIALIECP